MMEKAFAAAGLDWRYLTCEVGPDELGDAMRGIKAMGFYGGNITLPHKVSVIEYLDGLSEAAELMGAVNCIHCEDAEDGSRRYLGENTDGKGFVESLRTVTDPAGKHIVILGAGGAARAIAVELGLNGAAEITVVNRAAGRGQDLADLLSERVKVSSMFIPWSGDYEVPEGIEVVINATSIGLGDAEAQVPLALDSLRTEMVVADVIFNPADTWLLREAKQRGCTTLDGLGMLVNQAVIGFRTWTGIDPDASVMREALEEYLEI